MSLYSIAILYTRPSTLVDDTPIFFFPSRVRDCRTGTCCVKRKNRGIDYTTWRLWTRMLFFDQLHPPSFNFHHPLLSKPLSPTPNKSLSSMISLRHSWGKTALSLASNCLWSSAPRSSSDLVRCELAFLIIINCAVTKKHS